MIAETQMKIMNGSWGRLRCATTTSRAGPQRMQPAATAIITPHNADRPSASRAITRPAKTSAAG